MKEYLPEAWINWLHSKKPFAHHVLSFVHVLERGNVCSLSVGLVTICYGRTWIMNHQLPAFSRFDNPLPELSWRHFVIALMQVWSLHVRQLIYPRWLSCDWSAQSVDILPDLLSFQSIFMCTFAFLLIACIITFAHSRKILFVSNDHVL